MRLVRDYIAALNRRDLKTIEGMVDDDCCLIDSNGGWVRGRDRCIEAARRFFELPIEFELRPDEIVARSPDVLVTGQMHSSDPRLARDRLWRARIDGEHLVEWQSFASGEALPLARLLMPEAANQGWQGNLPTGPGEGT